MVQIFQAFQVWSAPAFLDHLESESFGKIEKGDFAMKRKFFVEQIVGVLKQAEVGVPVAELIRKVGIS